MPRPVETQLPKSLADYIALVPEDDIMDAFFAQREAIAALFADIPAEKADHAYAPGKWTLKEMFQHIVDAERIFAYRALCIARAEKQNLPGFDENDYAKHSEAWSRNWEVLKEELELVRRSTEIMFNSFNASQLSIKGLANGVEISATAIGFILVGHMQHHIQVIRERYL